MDEQESVPQGANLILVQLQAVMDAAREAGVHLEFEADSSGVPLTMWQKDHLVVSDDVADGELDIVKPRTVKPPTRRGGARLVEITTGVRAHDAFKELTADPRFANRVGLNNLASICPVNLCPADEPQPVSGHALPVPPWQEGDTAGRGVYVKVIDTGLATGYEIGHPWLVADPVPVGGTPCDARWPDVVEGEGRETYVTPGEIRLYAGHGEFIAGVIRCVAPWTRVSVSNALQWAGAATEYDLSQAILKELDDVDAPDILSLSAGTVTLDGLAHPAYRDVIARLREPGCRTLLVAAAGNDGRGSGPAAQFYPAAFSRDDPDLVVSVGALRKDRKGRACFSNYDKWVSVFEDGERLVNAFPVGQYTYHEPPRSDCRYYPGPHPLEARCTCVDTLTSQDLPAKFTGMASWSGTSFATPIVVARIARHMSRNPEFLHDARGAWRQLRGPEHVGTIIDDGDEEQPTELRVFHTPV